MSGAKTTPDISDIYPDRGINQICGAYDDGGPPADSEWLAQRSCEPREYGAKYDQTRTDD